MSGALLMLMHLLSTLDNLGLAPESYKKVFEFLPKEFFFFNQEQPTQTNTPYSSSFLQLRVNRSLTSEYTELHLCYCHIILSRWRRVIYMRFIFYL